MRISNSADYPMERLQPLIDYFSQEKVDALNKERACFVAEEGGDAGTAAAVAVPKKPWCFAFQCARAPRRWSASAECDP